MQRSHRKRRHVELAVAVMFALAVVSSLSTIFIVIVTKKTKPFVARGLAFHHHVISKIVVTYRSR